MESTGKTTAILSRLPAFYEAGNPESLLYQLVSVYAELLQATETDLFRVMRSHFVDTANNEGSQGLVSTQQGDLDKLFILYLENLGLTSQLSRVESALPPGMTAEEKYAPYRDRLKAMIQVLRRGAATKTGIRDIVAANLGIFGDDAAAQVAKQNIRIEEYLPELISDEFSVHPYTAPDETSESVEFRHAQTFTIENPNAVPTRPGFKLQVLDARPGSSTTALQPLINLRLFNTDTQEFFEFQGMLRVHDVLRVEPTGGLSLNGVSIPAQNLPPPLPRTTSHWHIEAKVGEPRGQFDQTLFELSRFDRASQQPAALNPEQASNYEIAVRVELIKQTPASFRVRVPWDIPGYTDKFSESGDHPRSQIPDIVDKVKAAGVLSVITYEKTWTEHHHHQDQLTVARSPFIEDQAMEEINFDIGSYQEAYPGGIQHEMTDTFITSGALDYTEFDSDNRFA
jgi:hypothetical protein